ncbi:hypothetical protein D3C86_1718220 [compost metagenome]
MLIFTMDITSIEEVVLFGIGLDHAKSSVQCTRFLARRDLMAELDTNQRQTDNPSGDPMM